MAQFLLLLVFWMLLGFVGWAMVMNQLFEVFKAREGGNKIIPLIIPTTGRNRFLLLGPLGLLIAIRFVKMYPSEHQYWGFRASRN